MTAESQAGRGAPAGFRARLLVAMMLLASAVAVGVLLFVQGRMAANARRDFERQFQEAVGSLHAVRELRNAMLAERCRALARRPRIHAALEDNALDLLYPSARDELADIMEGGEGPAGNAAGYALHAKFYRFLDGKGTVMPPRETRDGGELDPSEEARLGLPTVPDGPQLGYLVKDGGAAMDEVMAMPILSTETGVGIAAIVLGFDPAGQNGNAPAGIRRGVLSGGSLFMPSIGEAGRKDLEKAAVRASSSHGTEGSFEVRVGGAPSLLFFKRINPGSLFPSAYEVCIYALDESLARQRRLAWQFAGAGALLLLGAFGASQLLSRGLAAPVERLAADSAANRAGRERAEAALQTTSRELQRSARFSADASHQLKTPVTVLRSGLEQLLSEQNLTLETREEISALVHQAFRLTGIIEDLLLLSRLDAGRLQPEFGRVDLGPLVETLLDDAGARPGGEVNIEADLKPGLAVFGEKRYVALILENLLENARKYNRPGGRVRMEACENGDWTVLTVGNNGRPIPPEAWEHIFERFHRGTAAENVPGHGLGLNLARELARIHGGELRLIRSERDWTEFEVRLRSAGKTP